MKILIIGDHESKALWDYYKPGMLDDIDLILSCGDLNPRYLTFLVTLAKAPVYYICGNHDAKYESFPPEGCICIDGDLVEFNGVRILGLGGSMRYLPGSPNQYTEREMKSRIRKLWGKLLRYRGFDILLTHSPAQGINDGEDLPHQGFACFLKLLDKYQPKFFIHGHVHMSYGRQYKRIDQYHDIYIINGYEQYLFDYENPELTEVSRVEF